MRAYDKSLVVHGVRTVALFGQTIFRLRGPSRLKNYVPTENRVCFTSIFRYGPTVGHGWGLIAHRRVKRTNLS